jgi:hypothetical protein
MTSFQGKRCSHCQSAYHYQASGHGCGDGFNDSRYCPSCTAVVRAALGAVPVRFECRYFPVSEVPEFADVTRADIEEWSADLARRRREGGGIIGQRVWPALMNLRTGDVQNIREVVASSGAYRGIRFRVSSWTESPEYRIEIGLEWDLVNGTRGAVWR